MQILSSTYTAPVQNWSGLQKNAFRFFFIYLSGISLLAYNIFLMLLDSLFKEGHYTETHKLLAVLNKPAQWINDHFVNLGYNAGTDTPFFGDGHFGFVLLPTVFFIALAGTVIWAVADRKRTNYNRLHYWFRIYLCYYLFVALIDYAIQKIIPVQMPYPNIDSLITPLGERSKMRLVWDFVGISPAYSVFTGFCELLGIISLLSRRTRVFGTLFMTTVLTNVVSFNLFYNIQVKLLCMHLLLANLFLLAPYIPKLVKFFYALQPVSLEEKQYRFTSKWKHFSITALLLIPLWTSFVSLKHALAANEKNRINRKEERLYDVKTFIKGKDTILPLLTDTSRWKRLAITDSHGKRLAIIYDMQDRHDVYLYQADTAAKVITFIDNPDTSRKFYFGYTELAKNQLALSGKWNGTDLQMVLDKVNTDSLPIAMDKFKWMRNF